ncbi:hypothetical protein ASPCAL13598 [Aspergillus calidoustus]|uniref:Uncharacterized protein n=1 Tax=Aspergillus calidoustus TaxID=454130 RepID=A0A0U5GKN5_ASPCI|nr:hypothetical protein ASPCAL13598 [Aspergillus calidoustus]
MLKQWDEDWPKSSAVGTNRDTAWNWGQNHFKSFTFHLFNSDSPASGANTNPALNHKLKPGSGTEDNIRWVVGAVNILDNTKYRFANGKNAMRVNFEYVPPKTPTNPNPEVNPYRDHIFWDDARSAHSCQVEFDNTIAQTKLLKRGEQPTLEEMFNITSIQSQDYLRQ